MNTRSPGGMGSMGKMGGMAKRSQSPPIYFPFLPVAFALLLLSGCATGYREALAEYRAAEPLPFYQRTLAWVEEAPVPPAEPVEVAAASLAEAQPEPIDRGAEVAARVLEVTPEWLESRWQRLEGDPGLDAVLRGRLSLEDLLAAVALHNPRVQAAREAWLASLHQYSQAEYLEGLLRTYRGFSRYLDSGMAGDGAMEAYLPYPSTLTYKGEMIREMVRMAELDWEMMLRDMLVEAGTAYFDYQFQFRGAATVAENVTLLEDLVTVVQDRYATGLASQADVLRMQTEFERQRNLLRDFEARQRTAAAEINAMLGRAANAPLGRPASADLSARLPALDDLLATARERRQEVLAQEAQIAQMEAALRMGEIMNRPPLAAPARAVPAGDMAAAPAPMPGYAQAEAYLAELRQRLEAERRTLEQVQADTGARARALLEEADIARRQVALIEDVVLPLDRSAYDIALRAYTAGEMTFPDLVDAERKLIESRLELEESRMMKNQALLRLAEVRGSLAGILN